MVKAIKIPNTTNIPFIRDGLKKHAPEMFSLLPGKWEANK
jgi:hypothetical protein